MWVNHSFTVWSLQLVLVQSHLQHYAEPSTDPLPASTSVPGTLLPLGQGSFTHNQAGVPIIVTCTKADLIDGGSEPGPGGMVKGKGGEWEERTDGIMQILRTICLKCVFHPLAPSHSFAHNG